MDLKQLFETPISDITHIGNWEKNSSFRHTQDRKLLTNEKALTKIKAMWKYPEEVQFNIILVNHPDGRSHSEVGFVDIDWIDRQMPRISHEITEALDHDAVNVIFTNNNGDERVPMTGWVMAHRLGHAIQASLRFGGRNGPAYYFKEAGDLLDEAAKTAREWYRLGPQQNKYFPMDRNGPMLGFFQHLGTFKSAREKNLRNPYEFIYECLAQLMITGDIKFNDIPESFKYGPRVFRFCGDEDEYRHYNGYFKDDLSFQLKEYLETCLGYLEGKILLM